MARSEEYIEQAIEQAVTRNEIIKAVKRIKIGDTFRIVDKSQVSEDGEHFGKIVKSKVKKLLPHIAIFENGKSARYCDIAMYYRHGRKGVLR